MHKSWWAQSDDLSALDLDGKTVALFALGDQKHHGGTFAGAAWVLHQLWSQTGASVVGETIFDGYLPEKCTHLTVGQVLPGLLIDHVGQRNLTHDRIVKWTEQIRKIFS